VVVPVEDVEQSVGADAALLDEVEQRAAGVAAVAVESALSLADDRVDAAGLRGLELRQRTALTLDELVRELLRLHEPCVRPLPELELGLLVLLDAGQAPLLVQVARGEADLDEAVAIGRLAELADERGDGVGLGGELLVGREDRGVEERAELAVCHQDPVRRLRQRRELAEVLRQLAVGVLGELVLELLPGLVDGPVARRSLGLLRGHVGLERLEIEDVPVVRPSGCREARREHATHRERELRHDARLPS
jgi:hypothetical protein